MYNLITPWPSQSNGIADYSWEIARYTTHPLRVITRAVHPKLCGEHVGIESDASAVAHGKFKRHPNVYHFGNNPDHVFLIPLFLRFPGIAVIHDVSLHYLVERASFVLPGFFNAVLKGENPALAESLRALWQMQEMKRGLDFQECKLLSWLKAATSIIVHSNFAARAVAPFLPGKKVHVVPHFAYRSKSVVPAPAHARAAARVKLGLEDGQFVISTVGFVTRNKQYDAIMRALSQLPVEVRRKVIFLIAGEIRPHEYDLLDQINSLGCTEIIKTTGFLTEAAMQGVLDASDLVMSLRYPTYGESSGSVARALGLGCAVVVTDGGSYSELPDSVCMKIPAKADPSKEVAELILAVINDRNSLSHLRAAAVQFAHRCLDPSKIAARYSDIAHA